MRIDTILKDDPNTLCGRSLFIDQMRPEGPGPDRLCDLQQESIPPSAQAQRHTILPGAVPALDIILELLSAVEPDRDTVIAAERKDKIAVLINVQRRHRICDCVVAMPTKGGVQVNNELGVRVAHEGGIAYDGPPPARHAVVAASG